MSKKIQFLYSPPIPNSFFSAVSDKPRLKQKQ